MPQRRKGGNKWSKKKGGGRNKRLKTENSAVPQEELARPPSPFKTVGENGEEHNRHATELLFSEIVRGTRSQEDERYGPVSNNKQCTANAAVAIAYGTSIPYSGWNSATVDKVLDHGDELYRKSIRARNVQNSSSVYLAVIEVYRSFIIDNISFTLEILETEMIAGHVADSLFENEVDIPLAEGLSRIFQNFQSAIFTSSVKSIALMNCTDGFYVFDSHSRSANGEDIEPDGKACLLKFNNLDLMTRFLLRSYDSSQLYNLVPIQVQRTSIVANRNANITNENRQSEIQQTADLHYSGKMDCVCPKCNALLFPNENYICCDKGKIQIPTNTVYPDLLKALITDNHPKSRHYLKNIRRYNSLLALGSTMLKLRRDLGTGPPVIVVSGQIYHQVADIDLSEPSFGSSYFIDSGEANTARMKAKSGAKCEKNLLEQIDLLLRSIHPYAKIYCSLGQIVKEYEQADSSNTVQVFGIYFHNQPGTDRKVNAAPSTSDEIGAVFRSLDGNVPPPGAIRVQLAKDRSSGAASPFQNIPRMSPIVDALCYPLIFPNGELGWTLGLLKSGGGKRITMREFECNRLMSRANYFNPILFCAKLSQQFIVDKYVQIEGNRLYYLRTHQTNLRAENYVGLADYVAKKNLDRGNEERVGRFVILPSTFAGGTRFMIQNYQDAMAIVAKYGRPSLFVTFTCNPNWREIRENMQSNILNPQDRPELIARVFHLKMKEFFKNVKENKIFGEVIAYVYVVEFQKRGLPHMHCLLFLSEKDKLRNPDDVDKLICAELPDEKTRLFDIVMSTMIHGPCGNRNQKSPCMTDGQCTKHYPKSFVEETSINRAWPEYRRRNDGRTVMFTRNNIACMIDNRDVVPYSPYLSLKYESHIIVEVVTSVGSVKYVFKYINKGHDAATVAIRDECDYDEIKAFIESRYVSSGEAAWRLLAFPLQSKSHTIYRLPVHLPGERVVYFEEGEEEIALQRPTVSLLEAYFQLKASDVGARAFTYSKIPLLYSFDPKIKRWVKRVRNRQVIPRMYTISPKYVEKFHLRILLLHVPGAESFEDLRTHNGVTYATFKEAVQARGLITTDIEWVRTLEHAALVEMPGCMRKLFAYMLCFCEIADPLSLWNNFKHSMYEDYIRRGRSVEQSENLALCRIDNTLRCLGRRLQDFNLPVPILDVVVDAEEADNHQDVEQVAEISDPATLNSEQRDVFDRVIAATQSETTEERLFFVQGNGGCGKTYLYNIIIDYCDTHNIPSIAVAFTGIAALLLRNGRTVHSTFKLPLDVNEDSRSSITAQSEEADRLRSLRLIIWDEVSMASYHVVNAVDELLRDVCKDQRPFAGKCILLGGDVKQLLPVASGRVRQVELFFTNCKSWKNFKVLTLCTNMRVLPDQVDFMRWLEDLGQGKKNIKIYTKYRVCDDFVHLPKRCLTTNVIHEIYGDLKSLSREQLASRAILCPRNDNCNYLNDRIIGMFPGDVIVSRSIDSIASGDEDEIANFPEEYLNSITPSGMPLHELKLKVGIPIILLRNLCLEDGLINGTRLLVLSITDVLLTAEIITGRFAGRIALIPRLDLTSADQNLPFILKRHQFPVKVCFALTINKAQGQTFDQVGIYLGNPVFSHGQLYVAFSRARSWNAVKVEVVHSRDQGKLCKSSEKIFTKNIVYSNILNSVRT